MLHPVARQVANSSRQRGSNEEETKTELVIKNGESVEEVVDVSGSSRERPQIKALLWPL